MDDVPTPAPPVPEAPVDGGELPLRVIVATMCGVVATMLMAALDNTIVGTALPRVIADLQGFEHYAAVTTVYMVASTTVVPIAGKLSDLFGRKPFLLIGVVIFVVGSALCGAAQSMEQLVVFRGLQGIGGGFAQAMAFTTIADLFPPAKRGRIMGVMGGVFGLASVIGPAVGGFLTDGPGWRWCFLVNLPVGGVAFVVLLLAFPAHRRPADRKRPQIDVLGAVTLIAAVVPVLLALSWGGRDYAWDSPVIVATLGGGLAMAVVWFFVERAAPEPILPPSLFKNRVIAVSAACATLVAIGMFGSVMFIPLFIQGVIGTSATKSGAVLTPMMFAMILSSITAGQIITRTGKYKNLAFVGVGLAATGMGLLSRVNVDTSYGEVLGFMVVLGVGLGVTMPVFNLATQNAVDPRHVGVGTSSIQFLRSMGGSIGAAVFGAILANRFSPAFHDALPPDLAARLPAEMLARFDSPQALMRSSAAAEAGAGGASAASALPPGVDPQVMGALLGAVKHALASSIATVFFIAAVLVALAFFVNLANRDLPLRTTNRPAPTPE